MTVCGVLRAPRRGDIHTAVVLGYMGGGSHLPDLQAVAPALLNIARRYSERVLLRFLGAEPPPELLRLPNVAWTSAKTFDYAAFATDFVQQDYDIFFAPLKNNQFNSCKSPIKFLEYSAAGVPGVYSNLETYNSIVQHGRNGFLATGLDEWEEYLSRLVEEPDLRYEIAAQAQETVRKDWLLSEHAQVFRETWSAALQLEPTLRQEPSPQLDLALHLSAQVQSWQKQLQSSIQRQDLRVEELNQTQLNLQIQLGERDETIEWLNRRLFAANQSLQDIENSNSWNFMRRLMKIRRWLIPEGSQRERVFRLGLGKVKNLWNAAPKTVQGNPPPVEDPATTTRSLPAELGFHYDSGSRAASDPDIGEVRWPGEVRGHCAGGDGLGYSHSAPSTDRAALRCNKLPCVLRPDILHPGQSSSGGSGSRSYLRGEAAFAWPGQYLPGFDG